nr:hypothetical protein [Pseudomonas sp. BIGb0427]
MTVDIVGIKSRPLATFYTHVPNYLNFAEMQYLTAFIAYKLADCIIGVMEYRAFTGNPH